MRKTLSIVAMLFAFCCTAFAQRHTDQLDRGLVAMPAASGNFVSWRRQADESNNVTYNLYRGSTQVATGLHVTNFKDTGGNSGSTYKVEAVVNGEKRMCDAVGLWNDYYYTYNKTHTGYLDIDLATVYDRDGNDVTSHYEPNDAEMADLDGDGDLEIIIKRLNTYDASTAQTGVIYPIESKEFLVFDAYNVNWQTGAASLMWRVDCGPNMVSLNSTEANIIAYDWDEDGKAEVVLRGADNMKVYKSDGQTVWFTVGNMSLNSRNTFNTTDGQYGWTTASAEYLIYMNGETGEKYQVIDFPLPRIEESEWNNLSVSVPYNDYAALKAANYGNYFTKSTGVLHRAWGDNYGHRSSKYFMGAPVLDGRKASLFLGRGIYTRHKMIAMDLDKGSHQWSERWRWNCNDSNSPWYGNGYHNFVIADVDEDGRDEIVYGSMVIDDNGKGLSTSGYEHGDAQHVGDFDPYRKGLEFYGCLEDGPYYGSDYRNATTSEVYYKHTGGSDDGRAMMGNFSNSYPGSQGRSVGSGTIASLRNNTTIDALSDFIAWSDLNFRIYWDGDLCDEILNSPGVAREAKVEKPGTGRMFTSSGCNMNNDSKNNPCFQGDIIGDWREEIVVRRGTGLRVYTSCYETEYSMPCLWYDHQYRQAMVWQMMAYNQPPHVSYFVGEMEGITQAPPPLTNTGRTEIANGGSITSANTTPVMLCETGDMTVSVGEGAAPSTVFVNTPSWVQGTDVNGTTGTKVKTDGSVGATNLPAINTTTYTHTLTGNGFTGSTNLVKQGDGLLVLPNVTEAYTGKTDVWAGSLAFSGTLSSSPVWMNRHTKLFGAPTISSSLTMEYGSALYPSAAGVTNASAASYATSTISTLNMYEGSRMVIQIDPANNQSDQVNIGTLNLRTRSGDAWENYGPEYLKPVIQIAASSNLGAKKYTLGTLTTLTVDGTPVAESKTTPISSVVLEDAETGQLYFYQGKLILFLEGASWDKEKEYTTLYYNDYETAAKISDIRSGDYRDSQVEVSTNHYLKIRENGRNGGSGTMTFPSYSTNDYQEYIISFKMGFYTSNNKGSSFQIKSGSTSLATFGWGKWDTAGATVTYTIGSTAQSETLSAVYQTSGTRASDTSNSITTWYTFTITGSEEAGNVTLTVNDGSSDVISNSVISNSYVAVSGFYFTLGNAHAEIGFDDMLLRAYSENEVVPNPTVTITGVDGANRTVTMNLGTGSKAGTVIKYYTDTEQKSDLTTYTEPFVVNSTSTIYYYAESTSSAKSEEQSINVNCVAVKLGAPSILRTGANTYTITPTTTTTDGVTATQTIHYTVGGGAEQIGTSLSGVDGDIVAWATATGFTKSDDVNMSYVAPIAIGDVKWTYNLNNYPSAHACTAIADAIDEDKTITIGDVTYYNLKDESYPNLYVSNSSSWLLRNQASSAWKAQNNFTDGKIVIANAKTTDVIYFKVSLDAGKTYGVTATNATLKYSYNNQEYFYVPDADGNVVLTMPKTAGMSIYDVKVSSTIVSKTVTAAGWATYCSPYALDLANATGLTDAYIVTGASVLLSQL